MNMIGWIVIILLAAAFMYWQRRKILLSLMNWSIYTWVLRRVIPYIRFSFYYTTMRGWKYKRGYELLKPGHILLTKDNSKLSTFLIPGSLPHAALCVGKIEDGDDYEIGEMIAKGYTKSFFFDCCHEADRIVILDCVDWDDEYKQKVIEKCKTFEGLPYDLQFDFGVAALYCSELVYQADFERRLDVNKADLMGLNVREYITPQGLFNAKNVVVVWDSDQEEIDDEEFNTAYLRFQ